MLTDRINELKSAAKQILARVRREMGEITFSCVLGGGACDELKEFPCKVGQYVALSSNDCRSQDFFSMLTRECRFRNSSGRQPPLI